MTLIVQSSSEDVIALPHWLMQLLDLSEGDAIKTMIEGQTLHLTSLDHFLALRGALKDDQAFDEAMAYLNQAWEKWTQPESV
jgi:antitoxin component of MazEF toxin-antitoxin module